MLQVLQTITFTLIATWMSLAAALPAVAASKAERLAPGDGMFRFSGWAGPALDVYYHLPIRLGPTTPIVIVMHGVGRDAERYRNDWSALAEVNGFIVAVPEFDREDFRGSRSYNYGGFRDRSGKMIPRERWTFSAIEPLFDARCRPMRSTVIRPERSSCIATCY